MEAHILHLKEEKKAVKREGAASENQKSVRKSSSDSECYCVSVPMSDGFDSDVLFLMCSE